MDEATRKKVLHRLRIIRGQVEGLERMVRDDSYCVDVLTQVAAVQEALRGVSRALVRKHLETCVTDDIRRGHGQKHYDELMSIMHKLAR